MKTDIGPLTDDAYLLKGDQVAAEYAADLVRRGKLFLMMPWADDEYGFFFREEEEPQEAKEAVGAHPEQGIDNLRRIIAGVAAGELQLASVGGTIQVQDVNGGLVEMLGEWPELEDYEYEIEDGEEE